MQEKLGKYRDKRRFGTTSEPRGSGQRPQQGKRWLLIKMRDKGADRRRKPLKRQPRSVLSNSDLHEMAQHGRELR